MSSFLVVPGPASATTAEVWMGGLSLDRAPAVPGSAWLQDGAGTRWPIAHWDTWALPNGQAGVAYARTVIDGLTPRTRRRVELVVDQQPVAAADVTTLPSALPIGTERPLTVMLGSCFCAAEDGVGAVGRTFANLPGGVQPDLKFLTGDQIYLDAPFYKFLVPHTKQSLASSFFSTYAGTWAQSGDLQGFRQVLSRGAAYFTSDDHEFWNNAPYASFSVNTWLASGRRDWMELASGLYSAFQVPGGIGVRTLRIGDLSIFVGDTRIHRSGDRTTFFDPADMQSLTSWVAGLTFPGILVVGQPIFATEAGWRGRIADWNLPDFSQYAELCRVLLTSPQPIVILTGDVHYGRVARAVTLGGIDLMEIISSPMSRVTGGGSPEWHAAPAMFPAEALPNLDRVPITTMSTWSRGVNHFLTLELWQEGGKLRIRARSWETAPDAGSPSQPVFDGFLQRSM